MKKRGQGYLWFGIMAVIVLILGTVLTGCGSSSPNSSSALEATEESSLIASASLHDEEPQDGIKVHGHWIIEVMNPDGTLVESREFENALFTTAGSGAEVLAQLLTRQYSVGGWGIMAGNTVLADNPFFGSDPTVNKYAYIMEPHTATLQPYEFTTLTIGTGDGKKVVLRGTAIAQRDGSINQVHTLVGKAPNTEAPSVHYPAFYLTTKTLTEAIPVLEGQSILLTVELSFS